MVQGLQRSFKVFSKRKAQFETKATVLEEAKRAVFGLLLLPAFWPDINLTEHPFSVVL